MHEYIHVRRRVLVGISFATLLFALLLTRISNAEECNNLGVKKGRCLDYTETYPLYCANHPATAASCTFTISYVESTVFPYACGEGSVFRNKNCRVSGESFSDLDGREFFVPNLMKCATKNICVLYSMPLKAECVDNSYVDLNTTYYESYQCYPR